MVDTAKHDEDMAAVVERMAAKIMTLPPEKRSYVIESLRGGVLREITEEMNLKGSAGEHVLGLIIQGIEMRVREMVAIEEG